MYLPKKNKPCIIIKCVFLLLFLSVFLQTKILTARADEFVFDNSEGGFSGDIFWPDFLQDCGKDSYMDSRGELHDIQAEIVFNFESGKISGSIQGQYHETWAIKQDNTAQGTINGVIEKKNDHGYADGWYWEFSGEVDFSLHYHMEHLCQSDSGDYWESEDQTLNKKGVLSGRTWGELWSLNLRWEDQETRDGRSRYVRLSPDDSLIDIMFPKPIELDVSITMPAEVNLNSDSTPFQLNAVGRDIDMIDRIEWSFAYWEPDLEQYWLLYHESSFETQGLDTLEVSDAMRDEWRYVANEYGFEADDGSEIDLQIGLKILDDEGNQLIDFIFFEYTYYTSFGSEDTSGTGSTGGDTSTSESGSGSNPIVIPDVSSNLPVNLSGTLLQGAVSAGAGFGFVEMLKRFFGKTSMEQLTPKDLELLKEKLNKASTGASEGEDVLRLPTEDKYQKRNRISRARRSSRTYQRHKKRAETDNHYSKLAKGKNWTPKQEQEAIKAAKPKWLVEYTEKRLKKVFYFGKSYKELVNELSESEEKAFDSWNKWSKSWMRRHGAGNVGKFSDPHSFGISPGGSRA